ncbi:MAG: TetR/AcrR family transcriptional regulator [Actinomycetota bacterium]
MVQKASATSNSASKGRGRPRQFDADQVINAAIWAFFAKGFEATTLGDLEDATGVDRSTLYNSFGGKRGLYESATSTYLDLARTGLFAPLLGGGPDENDGYGDILEFLDRLRSGLTSATAIPGCLIVNDMAAGADPRAAQRYREMLEEGLTAALARAGENDPQRRSDRAGMLATSVLGVNLVSKTTDGDAREIGRLVDAMIDEVGRWRAAAT